MDFKQQTVKKFHGFKKKKILKASLIPVTNERRKQVSENWAFTECPNFRKEAPLTPKHELDTFYERISIMCRKNHIRLDDIFLFKQLFYECKDKTKQYFLLIQSSGRVILNINKYLLICKCAINKRAATNKAWDVR